VLPSLREALAGPPHGDHLDVLTPDGRRQAIVGSATVRTRIGYGRAVWNALTPSGAA
jgi:hypothetical protein